MIELDAGCNHITCRCKTEFCYVCCALWKTCACSEWDDERGLAEEVDYALAQLQYAIHRDTLLSDNPFRFMAPGVHPPASVPGAARNQAVNPPRAPLVYARPSTRHTDVPTPPPFRTATPHAEAIVPAPRADAIVPAPRAEAIVPAPSAEAIVPALRAKAIALASYAKAIAPWPAPRAKVIVPTPHAKAIVPAPPAVHGRQCTGTWKHRSGGGNCGNCGQYLPYYLFVSPFCYLIYIHTF